ncbi:MAG: beta-ketoacyl synthase N-terminal-like domain-containing protein [Clostridium sp.]
MNRVVVTGMGAITPVGNDVKMFWSSLKAGNGGHRDRSPALIQQIIK